MRIAPCIQLTILFALTLEQCGQADGGKQKPKSQSMRVSD